MILKRHKLLKVAFILSVIFAFAVFIVDVLYVAKNVVPAENVGLERWAIIITMIGIVGALKFLHPRVSDAERLDKKVAKQKFTKMYVMRLAALLTIFLFNILSYHFTGAKNFVYLAFITIFAMLLCVPNLKYLETQINGIDKNEDEEVDNEEEDKSDETIN